MNTIIIEVDNEEVSFIKTLLEHIKGVRSISVKEEKLTSGQTEWLSGLKTSVKEINDIKSGKKKGKSLESLLDEL
jgi:hypothetical protein